MSNAKIKKVVIFAGGEGTRLSEYTDMIPKPLVPIGPVPVIVHIMRHFYAQGYREFILAVGYKSIEFKRYFRDYMLASRDVTFTKNEVVADDATNAEDWSVTVVDTGLKSTTGQRLAALRGHIGDDDFFLTYGDSVSTVNLADVEAELYSGDKLAVLTAIQKAERFGVLKMDGDTITSFAEKTNNTEERINGGYIACRNALLHEVDNASGDFSHDTLTRLAEEGVLGFSKHDGFWAAMDTKRDVDQLNGLYATEPELFGGASFND